MLQRTDRSAAKRQRRSERKRRYRARCAAGVAIYPVEVDGPILDLLVRLHWLPEGDVHDRVKVGNAVSRLLADTVRRS